MAMWNPCRGCKRCSDGCLHCYIHKGDAKRGVDTSQVVKTKDFAKPVELLKNGSYKMKPGMVYTGFSSDFLIEKADQWRKEYWEMIKERQDCTFLFLTKRIERFMYCVPDDWNKGYDNVVVGGESDYYARPFDYSWALDIREQCVRKNVSFEFRQCGTHLIKDGKEYKLKTKDLCSQARKAGINFKSK